MNPILIFFAVVFSNLDRLLREQHAGNVALSIDNNQYLAKCREVFSVMRSTRAVSHPIVSKKNGVYFVLVILELRRRRALFQL